MPLKTQTQDPIIGLNVNFFGPEMTLARALHRTLPNLAVIKCAYAGTNLAVDWQKGIGTGEQLYELMMSQIDTALRFLEKRNIPYEFAGFFWMQGESDAANLSYANNYGTNLNAFIQYLRDDLNTPNLPFVMGRIGPNLPSPYNYISIVRAA